MQAKEAAERLGISQRMLRHYEKSGLLEVRRTGNGYRTYSEADLRRAGRVRDFIATGFSTREIRAMSACLSDDGAGPCEDGIDRLMEKLEHIERLRADLGARRDAVLDRISALKKGLESQQGQRASAQFVDSDKLEGHLVQSDNRPSDPGS
ncbi:MAG: MerR family transcriptional regulator [Pseudomonadota bacterium]